MRGASRDTHLPARRAIETAWKHLTPDEKAALREWADRMCAVDFKDETAVFDIVGAVLDCALDENPAFQAMLTTRLEEARDGQTVRLETPEQIREYVKSVTVEGEQ